jgi:hypothetical protein
MTTEDLWDMFTRAGVMIHCIRYAGRDREYGGAYLQTVEGEVIYFPANVPLSQVPELMTASPARDDEDPWELAMRNSAVADVVLQEVVQQTGLKFRFSGESTLRRFVFDGPNPTVQIEPDESVFLDGMPVTIQLSVVDELVSPCHHVVFDGRLHPNRP